LNDLQRDTSRRTSVPRQRLCNGDNADRITAAPSADNRPRTRITPSTSWADDSSIRSAETRSERNTPSGVKVGADAHSHSLPSWLGSNRCASPTNYCSISMRVDRGTSSSSSRKVRRTTPSCSSLSAPVRNAAAAPGSRDATREPDNVVEQRTTFASSTLRLAARGDNSNSRRNNTAVEEPPAYSPAHASQAPRSQSGRPHRAAATTPQPAVPTRATQHRTTDPSSGSATRQ